jgi:aminopeptidase N
MLNGHRALLACLALPAAVATCGPPSDATVQPRRVHPSFHVEVPPPLETGRLPDGARPRRYALSLRVDPAAERFTGEVAIDLVLARPMSAVVLHGSDLEITRAEFVTRERRVRAETSYRRAAGAVAQTEELVVVSTAALPPGDVQLRIAYGAPLRENLRGLYRVREGADTFAFTQLEPSDARRVFPCFDDPVFKVPFDVDVTVPPGNEVIANTRGLGRTPSADGRDVTFAFERSEPMPTYLVALAIGPLEVREGPRDPVPLRLVAARGKTKLGTLALRAATEQLRILSDYFGKPYPYAKLDLVAVPNFGAGAMENAGLITFREELLLVDEHASIQDRRNLALVMAHELAHQWFGNLVTMRWWDDLWLNEGFASWLEAVVTDRWQPAMQAELETLSDTGRVMQIDALAAARAVRQPVRNTYQAEEAFDAITYAKGAAVIGMLQSWLGEEVFRAGVRRYLAQNAWGNATAADLFRALSEAAGRDVAAVATSFFDRPGVPLVRADVICERGAAPFVALRQERYGAGKGPGQDDALWNIPVCVEHPRGTARAKVCATLGDRTMRLPLEGERCPPFVLPNAGHRGYYRYALSPAQLAALARAVPGLDARTKIGFLSNLWALLRAGEAQPAELVQALVSLRRERDRAVVEEVIATLAAVADVLDPAARPKLESFVGAQLLPLAQRLGWEARATDSDEERLLRRGVLGALAVLTPDDAWMGREGVRRAEAFFSRAPGTDPDAAAIAVRLAARRGDPAASFERLRSALADDRSPTDRVTVLRALGSLRDEASLARAFALLRDGNVRSGDVRHLVRAAVDWPDSRAALLAWLERELPAMADKLPEHVAGRMVEVVDRTCDASARAAAERIFRPLVPKVPGLERALREALEKVDRCIALRADAGAAFEAALRRR